MPVSYYGGPQLSRQNQKPYGKNKIPRGKTNNFTAKPKTWFHAENYFGHVFSAHFLFESGVCLLTQS